MKYVKLIAIFAVVAAGLYFALVRSNDIFDPDKDDGGFAAVDQIDINEFNEETIDIWAEKEWDSLIYIDRRGDIEQYRQMGMLSRDGYNSMRNCLFESSVNALCATYKASLKATSYGANPQPKVFNARVTGVYAGVPFLMKKEGKTMADLNSQPRLIEVKQLNDHYVKVFGFVYAYLKKANDYVRSEHTFTPKFKDKKWTSFESIKNSIITQAENYKTGNNKVLYDEMKTLPGFEEGLSKSWLEGKINNRFDAYYDELAVRIVDSVHKKYAYVVPPDKQCDTIPNQVRLEWTNPPKTKVVYRDKLSDGFIKIENIYVQFVKEFGRDKKGKGKDALGDLKKEYKADFDKLPILSNGN